MYIYICVCVFISTDMYMIDDVAVKVNPPTYTSPGDTQMSKWYRGRTSYMAPSTQTWLPGKSLSSCLMGAIAAYTKSRWPKLLERHPSTPQAPS